MLIYNTLNITLDEAIRNSFKEYEQLRIYVTRDDDEDKKEKEENKPTEKQEGFFKRLWTSIKNFFSKIWNWIKRLFVGEEKKLDKAEEKIDDATTPENKAAATSIKESIKYGREMVKHAANIADANYAVIDKTDFECDVAGMVMADVAKVVSPSIMSMFRKNTTHYVVAMEEGCNYFVNVKDDPKSAMVVADQLKETFESFKNETNKYQNEIMVYINKMYTKLIEINGKKKDEDDYTKEMETVVDYIKVLGKVVDKHKDTRAIAKYVKKNVEDLDSDCIVIPISGWVSIVNRCRFYEGMANIVGEDRADELNKASLKEHTKWAKGDSDKYKKLDKLLDGGRDMAVGVIDFIVIRIETERSWLVLKSNKNIYVRHGNVGAKLPTGKSIEFLESVK